MRVPSGREQPWSEKKSVKTREVLPPNSFHIEHPPPLRLERDAWGQWSNKQGQQQMSTLSPRPPTPTLVLDIASEVSIYRNIGFALLHPLTTPPCFFFTYLLIVKNVSMYTPGTKYRNRIDCVVSLFYRFRIQNSVILRLPNTTSHTPRCQAGTQGWERRPSLPPKGGGSPGCGGCRRSSC